MHFLPVFELMSDSLTATKVETYQCPSHESILLTQGPIHEIFKKKIWKLAILKNALFFSRPFWNFFFQKKKKNYASLSWKHVKVYWLARIGQNFDQAKRDNTFWPKPNILHPSVPHKQALLCFHLIFDLIMCSIFCRITFTIAL